MRRWLVHAPAGDRQVCTAGREAIGAADNPEGHEVSEVRRHGAWHERWDRKRRAWTAAATDEERRRVEAETALLTASPKQVHDLLMTEIAALKARVRVLEGERGLRE